MVTTDKFKKVFADKLQATGDMDKAFKKAVWIAFNEGILEGLTINNSEAAKAKVSVILKKAYVERDLIDALQCPPQTPDSKPSDS